MFSSPLCPVNAYGHLFHGSSGCATFTVYNCIEVTATSTSSRHVSWKRRRILNTISNALTDLIYFFGGGGGDIAVFVRLNLQRGNCI